MSADARRALPSVDAVLREVALDGVQRERLSEAVRDVLADARAGADLPLEPAAIAEAARRRLSERDRRTLRRVLNATGVVLQTNLGRAPLARVALDAIVEAAGAASVEYDLAAGKRGERHGHPARLLTELAGAEDAVVVNNNAAAVLLALAALAARKEVIVGRGELVEIGGGFRIPDVLRRSGATLVEVGTTNRTYAADFAAAIGPKTGAILRVHSSNFKVVGFTARAEDRDLAQIARERGVAFIHDLGSGTFIDTARFGLAREETVQEAVAAGADVVTFSGDKLLGGPQAGLAVGGKSAIAALRSHPLMRAVRPDKLTLAALVATLEQYRDGTALETLPVWRMIGAPVTELTRRAESIAAALRTAGIEAAVIETTSTIGGGSLPEETQPSVAVSVAGGRGPNDLARRLRAASPPVIARIVLDRLALDLRSVQTEDDLELTSAVTAALARKAGR